MNRKQNSSIYRKRCFILGGTGDIGYAIAEGLTREGCEVILHGRNKKRLEERIHSLDSSTVRGVLFDIQSLNAAIQQIEKAFPFDILIVAFGPFVMSSLADTTIDNWSNMVQWNLTLPGALISVCAPAMAANGWGRILFFGGSAIRTVRGALHTAAYCSAKAGIETLARSATREFSSSGVAVHVLYPGYVRTANEENIADVQNKKPIRIFEPEEVAKAAIWLLHAPANIVSSVLLELS